MKSEEKKIILTAADAESVSKGHATAVGEFA
jgi:hypothetical protein